MEALLTLGIAFGLMAILVFGMVLIVFLMLVGTVFSMVVASSTRMRGAAAWQMPRMVPAAPVPRRPQRDWQRDEVAA